MKAVIKLYNIQVDYCACMVAILLARHQVDSSNANILWSAVNLSEKLNLLPLSDTANFYVDFDALQHGMSIFQRVLNKRGMFVVPGGLEIPAVEDFFNLKSAQRVVKVKFLGYSSSPENETVFELLGRIRSIRDDLLRKSNFTESLHMSPSSVFSDLFLPVIISMRAPVKVKDVVPDKRPRRVTRKSPEKLKRRSMQNNTGKLLNNNHSAQSYCSVKARTILRWYLSEDKKNRVSGPKIETVFVPEVWSNLMLCMFENNTDQVK